MNAERVKIEIVRGNGCYLWSAVWRVNEDSEKASVHGADKTLEDAMVRAQRAVMDGLLQQSEVR